MFSVVTVVNILMLLYFHILNATTSLWTLEKVHHSEVERFLPPDLQCMKTTNQTGRGQEVRAGGDQVFVLLESLIHSPFLFWYTKTPTTAAATTTTAATATPTRMKTRR